MLITNQDQLNAFCKTLQNEEFITVDTEFLREKTYYPKLCLIQISGKDKQAAAIDPLSDLDLTPVMALMTKPDLLKVFHAARQDMEIFYQLMGELPAPLFDTQIAAMVCGFGDQIGYERLVREICDIQIDKSTQFTDWSRRPLSDKQINYALSDVTHLIDIYYHLAEELEKRGRTEWVFEEEKVLTSPATYDNPPEDAWQRIKVRTPSPRTLAVLRETAAWRERQAQKRNQPKNWVLRDDALADMAAQAPRTPKALSKIRNMSEDLANGSIGRQLLEAIERALESDQKTWPSVKKKKPLNPQNAAKLDMLRLLLKIKAANQDVAPKLIADATDLEEIVLSDDPACHAMHGWRYTVFGRFAKAMKQGTLAIGLKDGKIVTYTISDNTEPAQ